MAVMKASQSSRSSQTSWLILLALWVLLLYLSSVRPLAVPDEGRYAEVGRWMLQSGDWLTPRMNGIPFFHKPPLLHWLQASSMSVLGQNAVAARLVPALNAGLMLVALWWCARRFSGELIARRAMVMLGTSLTFLAGGQYVNHDMLVATWIGIAIWLFGLSFLHGERPHAGLARWGFVACALGVLSKGLIGLVLPGLVIFVWLIWSGQARKMLSFPWFSGLLIFAVIAVPWFVLAQQQFPGLWDYLFGAQQFQRYTGTTFNNVQPWWFYGLTLLLLLGPWLFFVLAQVGRASDVQPQVDRRVFSLMWVWVLAIAIFFSIPKSKLVGYILPIMPPLALLAAWGWERSVAHRRYARPLWAGLVTLSLATAVITNYMVEDVTRDRYTIDIAPTLKCLKQPGDTVYLVGGYPYDLPFLIQEKKQMVVVQNWPQVRQTAGDNWTREVFEGADFDAQAGQVLKTPDVLAPASQLAGNWLVAPNNYDRVSDLQGWTLVKAGEGWSLYSSSPAGATPGVRCPP
jgi:4-amino-4-deoxy-L-arabinose transferase-like glycosyltransferase